MDLNKLGKRSYHLAVVRNKIAEGVSQDELHRQTVSGVFTEGREVEQASETEMSDHVKSLTQVAEELVDVLLVCVTELHRRGVDIEDAVHKKLKYNEDRIQFETSQH